MKSVAIITLAIAVAFASWWLLAENRDTLRKKMAEKRLSDECLSNLRKIDELLKRYKLKHGEFPTNFNSIRNPEFDPLAVQTFRCRLCYRIEKTIFSLPDLRHVTNGFSTLNRFDEFSYAYNYSSNSAAAPNDLWVFCVGLHPKVHALSENGQVIVISQKDFLSYIKDFSHEIVYPTNLINLPQ